MVNYKQAMRIIIENWQYVDKLPREDMYMVLNILKLARSKGFKCYSPYYNSLKFKEMCEEYTNSR